jgi:hypothetical protein
MKSALAFQIACSRESERKVVRVIFVTQALRIAFDITSAYIAYIYIYRWCTSQDTFKIKAHMNIFFLLISSHVCPNRHLYKYAFRVGTS